MTALALTFALTAFVSLVGVGAFFFLLRRLGFAELLLSPAMGIAVIIIAILTLGKLGLPVAAFAWFAGAAGLALFGCGLAFMKKWGVRIEVGGREIGFFCSLLVAAVLSAAWPMLRFGFAWLSYTNEDMLNYTLSAAHWLHHAFFSFPNPAQFLANRNMSNMYWFMTFFHHERIGVDYFLSFVLAITHLEGTKAFMPFIVMLYAAMVAAMTGMVLVTSGSRRASFFGALFMLAAALSAHGAVYQLLGQEAGLALLCLGVALTHRFVITRNAEGAAALGVTFGGLGLAYPELLPFLVFAGAVSAFVNRAALAPLSRLWKPLTLIATAAAVFWNVQIPPIIYLLFGRVGGQVMVYMRASYQHFYLLPSGIPNFFGLTSLSAELAEPWLSGSILCGMILLGLLIVYTVKQSVAGNTASCIMGVFALAAASFFLHRSGFALFKLSMYCQPFVWAVFGTAVAAYDRAGGFRRASALGFTACLALADLVTQQYYVKQSMTLSMRDSSFLQVRNASGARLTDVFAKEAGQKRNMLLIDEENPALGKLVSAYAPQAEILFPSWDIMDMLLGSPKEGRRNPFIPQWQIDEGRRMQDQRFGFFDRAYYRMPQEVPASVTYGRTDDRGFHPAYDGDIVDDPFFKVNQNLFMVDNRVMLDEPHSSRDVVVTGAPVDDMNVEGEFPIHAPAAVVPLKKLHNHLVFVRSSYGGIYLDSAAKYIGLYQPEADYFQTASDGDQTTMTAMGRYLVFNVLEASPSLHLVIDMSNTLRTNNAQLPRPIVIGKTSSAPIEAYGRGSARIISPAITPMEINGQAFAALDLNQEPVSIEPKRSGLQRLFGNDVPLDPRRFVAYTRGISAISDAVYKQLRPPTEIASFPKDLIDNRALEYSGIYEDGWASEEFALRLRSVSGKPLSIEGIIPNTGDPAFTTEASVYVNGVLTAKRHLGTGVFSLEVPSGAEPASLLHVRFSRAQRLSQGDPRVASMRITRIGASASPVIFGSGWYPQETYEGQTFRWMSDEAEVQTQDPAPRDLVFDVAPGPGVARSAAVLDVSVDAAAPVRRQVTARSVLRIPVTSGMHTIRLRVLNGRARIASDPRILNLRVFSASLKS